MSRKPEDIVRDAIIKMLKAKDWYAKTTHGSVYQSGFPDIYATHRKYGHRWIEVKLPTRRGDVFTKAQHEVFRKLCAFGDGVWVLVGYNEFEYNKLFRPYNWYHYLQ